MRTAHGLIATAALLACTSAAGFDRLKPGADFGDALVIETTATRDNVCPLRRVMPRPLQPHETAVVICKLAGIAAETPIVQVTTGVLAVQSWVVEVNPLFATVALRNISDAPAHSGAGSIRLSHPASVIFWSTFPPEGALAPAPAAQ